MKSKCNIVDKYYKSIEENYCYKTCEELLGKKYFIDKQLGIGNFSRMKIENGLEVSMTNINDKMNMDFNNKGVKDNILEIGYCYNGGIEVTALPNNKNYIIKTGDIFIYKMINNVDNFKFKYNKLEAISIHIDFNNIKNAINPIWENKIIMEWESKLDKIFKEDMLIVEKAKDDMKKIAEEIKRTSIDDVIGYMKLKISVIQFLTTFLEEKSNFKSLKNEQNYENELVIKVENIINKNLKNIPPVKEIANVLNISLYKLQQAFKNITGSTVYEYIKRIRIEKSKYLLKNTDMQIIEIANEIGYENPSKFASLFKNYNNVTPLKYRKLQENNYQK